MTRRRLQCGGCGTVIKVGSHVSRPVCPRCNTAHTFIKCGKPTCGTLMCLPENVNQFSCPRCGVQLARPGFAQTRGPTVVRCGNTTCGFLLSVGPGVTRFSCPKCSIVQLLPGTEEASKRKAALDEEIRQKKQMDKERLMLQDLCAYFGKCGIDDAVVEVVFDDSNHERPKTIISLVDMIDDEETALRVLHDATCEQMSELNRKQQVIAKFTRCPISQEVMENPVFAADGYTYERKNIEEWLKTTNESPLTKETLSHKNLIPNHQLRGEIESWKEHLENIRLKRDPAKVIPQACHIRHGNAAKAIEVDNLSEGSDD